MGSTCGFLGWTQSDHPLLSMERRVLMDRQPIYIRQPIEESRLYLSPLYISRANTQTSHPLLSGDQQTGPPLSRTNPSSVQFLLCLNCTCLTLAGRLLVSFLTFTTAESSIYLQDRGEMSPLQQCHASLSTGNHQSAHVAGYVPGCI